MSMRAEQLVQEWLNRQGYFTIRGIRLGVPGICLLASKPVAPGWVECRQVEVQVSRKPNSYLCGLPPELQKEAGMATFSPKKRSYAHMEASVNAWIAKKFDAHLNLETRKRLCSAQWARELVVDRVKHEEELKVIEGHGIKITPFSQVVRELREGPSLGVGAPANDSLIQLMKRPEGTRA